MANIYDSSRYEPFDDSIIAVRVLVENDFIGLFLYPQSKLNRIFNMRVSGIFRTIISVNFDIKLVERKAGSCAETSVFRFFRTKNPTGVIVRQYVKCWNIGMDDPLGARHALIRWLRASFGELLGWCEAKGELIDEAAFNQIFEEGVRQFWAEDDPEINFGPLPKFLDVGKRCSALELRKKLN